MINMPVESTSGRRRMVRYRPSAELGAKFPAMHLVRSSWFARSVAKVTFYSLVLFVVAAVFVPWQQTSKCTGVVTARNPNERRQVFLSTAKGVIKSQLDGLKEGSFVRKGDVLMVLDTMAVDQVELTQSQLKQLREKKDFIEQQLVASSEQVKNTIELGQQQVRAAQAKVEAARSKWRAAQAEVVGQQAKLNQAQFNVNSLEPLRQKTISEQDFQKSLNEESYQFQMLVKAQKAEDQAFQDLHSEESLLESKRQEVDIKNQEAGQKVNEYRSKIADVEKELQDVRVKLGELERTQIVSPNTGRVQSILGQVGKTVDLGDRLFEIIPDTEDLWVELSVRGMDQPLIHEGDKVRLQFDGWPAIQFVGWPSVARGTFGGVVIAINPADDGHGNFKIFVGPDPDDPAKDKWPDRRYLRQGVRANAWVIMDSVPLGIEIWRQLNGFPLSRDKDSVVTPSEKEAKAPKLK